MYNYKLGNKPYILSKQSRNCRKCRKEIRHHQSAVSHTQITLISHLKSVMFKELSKLKLINSGGCGLVSGLNVIGFFLP